jgi:hypothetical protein
MCKEQRAKICTAHCKTAQHAKSSNTEHLSAAQELHMQSKPSHSTAQHSTVTSHLPVALQLCHLVVKGVLLLPQCLEGSSTLRQRVRGSSSRSSAPSEPAQSEHHFHTGVRRVLQSQAKRYEAAAAVAAAVHICTQHRVRVLHCTAFRVGPNSVVDGPHLELVCRAISASSCSP